MKKSLLKVSGIISIFISLIFFVIGFLFVCNTFNFSFIADIMLNKTILNIYVSVSSLFYLPIIYLFSIMNVSSNIISQILAVLTVVLSIITFVVGIREIVISKKDDEKFLKSKKTLFIFNAFKFIFILLNIYFIVSSFVFEDISNAYNSVSSLVGIPFFSQIIASVMLVFSLATFFSVTRAYKNTLTNQTENNEQSDSNNNLENNQNDNQVNMQDNGQTFYQQQSDNADNIQPIYANSLVRNANEVQKNPYNIVPGENGVPINISEKGLEDLARLERLKISGTIDDRNYRVLKEKICRNNLNN